MRSLVRVLVVDDFAPFRRLVSQTLQNEPELEVVAEASEGLEAVEKAQELQPDLILLDIGLPKVNGIEAAHRIRKLSPESKILFVSQESSAAVAQAALETGAKGYVAKAAAGHDLVPAVEAILNGGMFVSSILAGRLLVNPAAGEPRSELRRQPETARHHEVAFWPDDASLVHGYSRFIEDALRRGSAVIFVATELHRNSLLQRLRADGVDVGAAIEEKSYIPVDAAELLSTFMVRDSPDPARLTKVADDLITQVRTAKGGQSRVTACGECAPTLLAEGKAEAAIELERLWDELVVRRYDVDLLCGYSCKDFPREDNLRVFERVCAEHSIVRPA